MIPDVLNDGSKAIQSAITWFQVAKSHRQKRLFMKSLEFPKFPLLSCFRERKTDQVCKAYMNATQVQQP